MTVVGIGALAESATQSRAHAGGPNLDLAHGLAFDSSGDLWVSNNNLSTIVEYTPSQLASSGAPTPVVTISSDASSSLDEPYGLAFDSSGDLWAVNFSNSTVVEFTPEQLASSGAPTPNVTISSDGSYSLDYSAWLAFDSSGDLWVQNSVDLVEFTPTQVAASGAPTPAVTIDSEGSSGGNYLFDAEGMAFDSSGDLWVSNPDYSTVLELTPSQLEVSCGPLSQNSEENCDPPAVTLSSDASNSLDDPDGVAFDSSGDMWVTNDSTVVKLKLSQLRSSGSPTPTVTISSNSSESLYSPLAPAFDTSRGLWMASPGNNTVIKLTPSQYKSSGAPKPAVTLNSTTTKTRLSSSANPASTGEIVTYKAKISPVPGGGSVEFTDNGTPIPGCSSQTVNTTTGKASCEVSYSSTGTHSILAIYSGVSNAGPYYFDGSKSTKLTETVN